MAKIQLPAEFKGFSEKFDALAYGQDASRVFDDMLAYIVDLFSFDNPWEPHGRYKDPEIRKRFFELFQEIVLLRSATTESGMTLSETSTKLKLPHMPDVQMPANFLLRSISLT